MIPGPAGKVSAPGFAGRTYGVGDIKAYSAGVRMRPKCPCAPPPSVVGTRAALAFISFQIFFSDSYAGRSCILVSLGYSKCVFT